MVAFRRARQDFNPSVLSNVRVRGEIVPGLSVSSDAEILTYIRSSIQHIWHTCQTCAMSKSGDLGAVMDAKARVFGVTGLRVMGASAFLLAVPGHSQAAVYMTGKIAHEIIREVKLRFGKVSVIIPSSPCILYPTITSNDALSLKKCAARRHWDARATRWRSAWSGLGAETGSQLHRLTSVAVIGCKSFVLAPIG